MSDKVASGFPSEDSMSHIVEISTQVRDPVAIAAACARLNLDAPIQRTAQLYDGQYAGLCVDLPGWRYPLICIADEGQIKYDNFQGRWGEQKELDRFLQAYAVEKAKLEARRNGHAVTEQTLADGSVHLTVQVVGGAA
jgi:hypothetical protein